MKECTSKILATAVLTALAAWSTPASAGFPFLTDDPGTQGIGKWEIDIFSQYARARAGSAGAFAAVQVNYGLTDNFDLQAQAPWAFAQANGVGTNSGIGDAQAGFKFRFVDEDKDGWRPAVAFVPAVIAPTGSAPRGLGAGYTRAFLPVWLSKSFGELTVFGGGGFNLNTGNIAGVRQKNFWFNGIGATYDINDDWTVGAEAYYASPVATGARNTAGFNVAAIRHIDEVQHVMVLAGRNVVNAANTNEFTALLAYQLKF